MSSRKSIAKVQLGSTTPDKAALQYQHRVQAGEEGLVLPSINGHGRTAQPALAPSEMRSAEKVPSIKLSGGGGRPGRASILQRPSASLSSKGQNENAESNSSTPTRTSRASIVHKQPQGATGGGAGEASATEPQPSMRISRPSILNKQPAPSRTSDKYNDASAHRRGSAHKSSGEAVPAPGSLSPSAPTTPKGSSRTHRGTVIKHLPKGEVPEGVKHIAKKKESPETSVLVTTAARELSLEAIAAGMKNILNRKPAQTKGRSQSVTGFVEQLARDCISLSIQDALKNITTKM